MTLSSSPSLVSTLVTFFVTLGKCRNGLRGKVFGGSTHHLRDAHMARVLNLLIWELAAVDSHVLMDQDTRWGLQVGVTLKHQPSSD